MTNLYGFVGKLDGAEFSPRTVFLVMASSGEYSDRTDWPVWVHTDLESARAHVERLRAFITEVLKPWENGARDLASGDWELYRSYTNDNPRPQTPDDQELNYSETDYWIVEIPCGGVPAPKPKPKPKPVLPSALPPAALIDYGDADD